MVSPVAVVAITQQHDQVWETWYAEDPSPELMINASVTQVIEIASNDEA